MKERLFKKSYRKTIIIFSAAFLFAGISLAQAQSSNPSQKKTVVNGKTFIEHSVTAKDTYYQLSRIYGIPVKDIMNANNKKNLRVGDAVYIPFKEEEKKPENKPEVVQNEPNNRDSKPLGDPNTQTIQAKILTEYKVGSNETLYSIAKRFSTTVDNIKKLNSLDSDTVREGQTLKIPDGNVVVVQKETAPAAINLPIPENISKEEIEFETNRYGIREKKRKRYWNLDGKPRVRWPQQPSFAPYSSGRYYSKNYKPIDKKCYLCQSCRKILRYCRKQRCHCYSFQIRSILYWSSR